MGSEGFSIHGRPLGRSGGNFRPSPPRQEGLSLAAHPRVSPGGYTAACAGPQFSLRASHKRALTPHSTNRRAAPVSFGRRAPLCCRSSSKARLHGPLCEQKIIFSHPSPPAPFCAWKTRARPFPASFSAIPLFAAVYPGNRHTQNETRSAGMSCLNPHPHLSIPCRSCCPASGSVWPPGRSSAETIAFTSSIVLPSARRCRSRRMRSMLWVRQYAG